MTITPVGLLRLLCLAFGIGGLLAGTVLFPFMRRFVPAWLQMAQRLAGPQAGERPAVFTRFLASAAVLRAWQLVCAAIGLGLWWYFGTASGAAFLASALRPH
jgi:hypothetical protein